MYGTNALHIFFVSVESLLVLVRFQFNSMLASTKRTFYILRIIVYIVCRYIPIGNDL